MYDDTQLRWYRERVRREIACDVTIKMRSTAPRRSAPAQCFGRLGEHLPGGLFNACQPAISSG